MAVSQLNLATNYYTGVRVPEKYLDDVKVDSEEHGQAVVKCLNSWIVLEEANMLVDTALELTCQYDRREEEWRNDSDTTNYSPSQASLRLKSSTSLVKLRSWTDIQFINTGKIIFSESLANL
ncbi:hypothetical protein RRG08_018303 [Elysia crispata]|uniref:Uncharacterized protein n=1 Tax=Elysia crispata TaxID=231223 RepID=A0AAE0YJS1_9GAST|nr:hypothetical protein RRG08_018303 [Elysia crispata]